MVRRTSEQEAEPYRAKAAVPAWEYPVIEVCWADMAAAVVPTPVTSFSDK
jgi:hypothetical protein